MTDFDKLIKEKADSAHFQYKASAWKQLASQAGFKVGLSGLQIALVSIALVAVVGGAIFFLSQHNSTPAPAPRQATPETIVGDTSTAQPQNTIAETQTCTITATTVNTTEPAAPETSDEVIQPDVTTVKDKPDKVRPTFRRTVRINVDTISDNMPSNEQLKQANSNL